MRGYLILGFVTAVVSFFMTWLVWRVAMRFKLYPEIRARDVHTHPTPRLGGIAIFVAFSVAVALASRISWFSRLFDGHQLWALVVAAAFICGLGIVDDIWDLDWYTKLAGQFLAAWWLAWQGFQIVSLPIGGVVIGSSTGLLILTMFSMVLVMNAVNFIDGLDGLVSGVVLIAGSSFFVYSYAVAVQTSANTPNSYFTMASLITVVTVGAVVGFLPFNWHPAKIFLGDSGALQLGMFLSAASIAVTGQVDPSFLQQRSLWLPTVMPMVVPLAILIAPLADFTLAVVRRLRAGKSPFSADRKHLHHRMLDAGHGVVSAVFVFYAWTALVSICSIALMLWRWQEVFPFALAGFAICVGLTFRPVIVRRMRKRRQSRADS